MAERRMRQFGANIQNIGRKAFTAGLGGVAAFSLPMNSFIKFDDAIRMTGAVSQATGEDLEKLRQHALDLDSTFSKVDVATLMGELGKAGFKPDQIIAMTKAVLDMARATGTDATLSAGIMASTIRQFSLDATDATRVANVLTHAANATFNSVESLGESLSYAGPVAAQFGMSMEEAVAVLGTLGNVGIQGSNAGTALRRMLTLTAADAEKMKEIFGVSFLDAAGNIRPMITVMGELSQSMNGLASGKKAEKMNEAFGLLGITGATVMSNTAADTQRLAEELVNVGNVAADTAKTMDAGAGGGWRRLMVAIEESSIAIGEALSSQFMRLADWLTTSAVRITEWITNNEGMIVSVAKATGYLMAGGAALIVLGKAFAVAAFGAKLLGVAVTIATTPMLLIPALLAGIGGYLAYTNGLFGQLAETLTGTFGGAWDLIVAKISSGDLAGAMSFAWELTKATWDLGIAYLMQGWQAFGGSIISGLLSTMNIVTEMWGVLWDSVNDIAAYAWAAIKDTLQAIVDWGNRLVGRDVPNRKTHGEQVTEASAARQEERARISMEHDRKLQEQLARGEAEKQSAVDAQLNKIAQLIATEQARMDLQKPGATLAEEATTPSQVLSQTLASGAETAVRQQRWSVEAVSKHTVEGQAAAFEAMNQSEKDDTAKITGKLDDVVAAVEDQTDFARKESRNAPRLAGSRKG